MAIKDIVLNDGNIIPGLGFGTWQTPDGETVVNAVKWALKTGFRLIDTAVAYRNETGVGRGLKASGLARDKIFVTTKIQGATKTYEGAKAEIDGSLERLGLDYLDLVLIHCPKPWPEFYGISYKTYDRENLEVWRALEEARKAGKVRSIGISNFGPKATANIVDHAAVKPAVNQIRYFIGLDSGERPTIDYCKAHGIAVEAYSPLNTGELLGDARVNALAAKYHKTLPQLAIAYCLNKGLIPLPKSTHEQWIRADFDVDFRIADADLALLDGIKYQGEFRQPD